MSEPAGDRDEMNADDSIIEQADVETSSAGYARRFSGPAGEWMLGVQEQLVKRALARCEVKTILDVGGGHGQLAPPLSASGYAVTVLGSPGSCGERLAQAVSDGCVHFMEGNVVALPVPDQSFDAVVSVRLLPHCTAWQKLCAEMCRVARQLVVLDYPTPQSLNAIAPLFFGMKKKLEGNTREWRAFRHKEIAAELAGHGFAEANRFGQFFWPMALHRALGNPLLSRVLEWPPRITGLSRLLGSPVLLACKKSTQPASDE